MRDLTSFSIEVNDKLLEEILGWMSYMCDSDDGIKTMNYLRACKNGESAELPFQEKEIVDG